MKRLIAILAFALCVFLSGSVPARADEGMTGYKIDLDKMFMHKAIFILEKADQLGLSDEQAGKIKLLKYAVEKSLVKSEADIESTALDIREGLEKDEADVNSLNTLIDKQYEIKGQQDKDMIAAYAEFNKILTKDQVKKLKSISMSGMPEEKQCMRVQKEEAGPMMGEEKEPK